LIPQTLKKLIFELSKLPSVGERSAYRIAYHLLGRSESEVKLLTRAIEEASTNLKWCEVCCGLTDRTVCDICLDSRRDNSQLCVVERPSDVFSLERSGAYRGLYHVLHGVWSPLRGVTPEQLTIQKLVDRFSGVNEDARDPLSKEMGEVILATSTTVEGDATALYISKELDAFGLTITRLAQGLPKGGELEYADDVTLGLSFEGRRRI
jgi:recombination protein RecR